MYYEKKKKLTLPIAKSPLSNSNNIPRKRNDMPKPAKPTPISFKNKINTWCYTYEFKTLTNYNTPGVYVLCRSVISNIEDIFIKPFAWKKNLLKNHFIGNDERSVL